MPNLTSRRPTVSDTDLEACIKLVKAVSNQANTHDFNKSDSVNVGNIHKREKKNGWLTWLHRSGGNIDACAFFQFMLSRNGNYAMCMGFDKNVFPMLTDNDCITFINTVAGNGHGDGFLRDFFLNVLPSPSVYVVDQPLTLLGAKYNQQLDNLFLYVQSHSPGPNWSITLDPSDTGVDNDFWGGNGLNLWKLTVS